MLTRPSGPISLYGDGGRLTSKGYGETKPVASNKDKEGRQKNRRVYAKIMTAVTK